MPCTSLLASQSHADRRQTAGLFADSQRFTAETDSPLEEGVSCELVSGNPDFNVRKKRTGVQKPSLISILIRFNDY